MSVSKPHFNPDPYDVTDLPQAYLDLVEQYENAIKLALKGQTREAEIMRLQEQLETQVGLIRDLASELASVSDIAAAPDGDYERWLRGLLARADAAVTGSGEPGV